MNEGTHTHTHTHTHHTTHAHTHTHTPRAQTHTAGNESGDDHSYDLSDLGDASPSDSSDSDDDLSEFELELKQYLQSMTALKVYHKTCIKQEKCLLLQLKEPVSTPRLTHIHGPNQPDSFLIILPLTSAKVRIGNRVMVLEKSDEMDNLSNVVYKWSRDPTSCTLSTAAGVCQHTVVHAVII